LSRRGRSNPPAPEPGSIARSSSKSSEHFRLDQLDLDGLAPGLHLPVSELKHLRRELVTELERQLTA
jgi:hypothetical protein